MADVENVSVPVAPAPHDWVMLATFVVSEQTVEQLAAARVDPSGEGRAGVEMTEDLLDGLDGPGCRACGLEWTVGYGVPCAGGEGSAASRAARAAAARSQVSAVPPPSSIVVPEQSRLILP